MLYSLLTLAFINIIGAVSPGPDFFIVSQTALSKGKAAGIATTAGIVTGVGFWALLSLLGLKIIFDQFHWIQSTITFLGGCYLTWVGFCLLKSAARPSQVSDSVLQMEEGDFRRNFLKGLMTNLSNPKCCIFFASIFTAFLPEDFSFAFTAAAFLVVVVEAFIWFVLVSTLFSRPKIRSVYVRCGRFIDGAAGLVFAGFGLGLVAEAVKEMVAE